MKKSTIAAFLGVLAVGYYSKEIYSAHERTKEVVDRAKAKINLPITKTEIGEKRLRILLKYQDENFYDHGGTDFISGRITTITQGLVKFLYFEKFKPGLAKIKQSLIARFVLNERISKEEQLYLFLNLAYLGTYQSTEVRGFELASRTYFNKSLISTTDDEFLALLVMLSAPDGLNVKLKPKENAREVALLKGELNDLLY